MQKRKISCVVSRLIYLKQKDERVVSELEFYGISYRVVIQKNEERNFDNKLQLRQRTFASFMHSDVHCFITTLRNHGPGILTRSATSIKKEQIAVAVWLLA